jgi:hypothetical protein
MWTKINKVMLHKMCSMGLNTMYGFDIMWRAPKFLIKLQWEFEVKTMEEQGVKARSLTRSTLGLEGRVRASGWDLEEGQTFNHSHGSAQTKRRIC